MLKPSGLFHLAQSSDSNPEDSLTPIIQQIQPLIISKLGQLITQLVRFEQRVREKPLE